MPSGPPAPRLLRSAYSSQSYPAPGNPSKPSDVEEAQKIQQEIEDHSHQWSKAVYVQDLQKHFQEQHSSSTSANQVALTVDTVQPSALYSMPRSARKGPPVMPRSARKGPPVNVDSGAGKAMSPCLAHVAVKTQLNTGRTQQLSFANGETAVGTTVDLSFATFTEQGEPFTICIPGGIFCSHLSSTLLSVGDLIAQGFTAAFAKDKSTLHSPCGAKIKLDFNADSNLWFLPTTADPPTIALQVTAQQLAEAKDWHSAQGHPRGKTALEMARDAPDGPSLEAVAQVARECEACLLMRRIKQRERERDVYC